MKKAKKIKTVRTNLTSLAILVGSVLWFGEGVGFAQDEFFHEHSYYESGRQEAFRFGFGRGFHDGLDGRRYENLANNRAEYAGYEEGYRRGRERFLFSGPRF